MVTINLATYTINPLKKIENAIKLARVLKDSNIGKGMKIVGSISPHNLDYYSHLNKLVEDFDLAIWVITLHLKPTLALTGSYQLCEKLKCTSIPWWENTLECL